MRTERAFTIGVGTMIGAFIASGIMWWTGYRFLRWIIG